MNEIAEKFFKAGLPNIGKKIIQGAIKTTGKVIASHPVGGILKEIGVLDAIGEELGIESEEEKVKKIETMSVEQLAALTKLKEVESKIEIAEIESRNIEVIEDTKRIEAVNETMKVEVLGNPASGEWRPLWGRWACYNFFPTVYLILAIVAYATITNKFELFTHLPHIIGGIVALYALPGAILGVASWKRGQEKIELAKNLK